MVNYDADLKIDYYVGLKIINVNDPLKPVQVGSFSRRYASRVCTMEIEGKSCITGR